MPNVWCDLCGERFNSKHHLELHEEYADCEASQPSSNNKQEERTHEITHGSEVRGVEGTITDYNNDDGYGFMTTVDLASTLAGDVRDSQDVFFHISEVESGWVEEGDRIQCAVVESDQGLECQSVRVIKRAKNKEELPEPERAPRRQDIADEDIDTRYGAGRKQSTSDQDIENFSDERKFR